MNGILNLSCVCHLSRCRPSCSSLFFRQLDSLSLQCCSVQPTIQSRTLQSFCSPFISAAYDVKSWLCCLVLVSSHLALAIVGNRHRPSPLCLAQSFLCHSCCLYLEPLALDRMYIRMHMVSSLSFLSVLLPRDPPLTHCLCVVAMHFELRSLNYFTTTNE